MLRGSLLLAALAAGINAAQLRFSCSQLVVDRLDPLVNPGQAPSPHLHQIVGGNAFNVTMDHEQHDISQTATCTSCQFTEDFSNYWTAVLFFKARNGTYKRVSTVGNGLGYSAANGGQTVYYLSSGKVTAFKPGFRMLVGDPSYKTEAEARRNPALQFTCLASSFTRTGYRYDFPTEPCAAGIMVTVRFPTCWDGRNVDSPDHKSHVAYPVNRNCPSTHPVRIPEVFYETYWDTRPFNDRSQWPTDGSQPFVWSFGDSTGYGNHGDYIFGWRGDALQRAMDANCVSDLIQDRLNCPTLRSQSITEANKCQLQRRVREDLDGWLDALPGLSEMSK
ncbi:hypothetical protein MMYC01_202676 [Madurella mycetomatis]|uniref:DUF1996 domain-containing protein n=1 Tax=Madurella mycetomatis TaxID=100816 RepID=A0A175WAU8_9PEZI|nr:hypothetical protein MMYC01_202676 [Madurella mycetomatis]